MTGNEQDGWEDHQCPRCGSTSSTSENPVLDDTYECSRCVIAFNADGEVLEE